MLVGSGHFYVLKADGRHDRARLFPIIGGDGIQVVQQIEDVDLTGRSLSQVVETRFYMRPIGGRQSFRIAYLEDQRKTLMELADTTPVLEVHRFLNFKQADNAVFAKLFCNTQNFVFSQQIGGLSHD